MEPLFRESRPVLPRNLAVLVAVVLAATLAFMAFSEFALGTEMPSWTIPVTLVVFVVVIIIVFVLRMDVEVTPEGVEVRHAFRRVPMERREILEVRSGELGEIRNYGGWNLKGVKHRSYTRIGDDLGVALKLTGKRVVVFSTEDPSAVAGLIPIADPVEEAPAEAPEETTEQSEGEE